MGADAWKEQGEQERAALEELFERSNALPPGQIVGGLLRFPRADGYALYIVVKESPLTIAHIPSGDAWTIEPALIRGLRKLDILQMLESVRRINAIFAKKE
jgi:hypothetical protein